MEQPGSRSPDARPSRGRSRTTTDLAGALQLQVLRSFVRVVELGSITLAGRSLFLAQSAISMQLTGLTALVGSPLLERRQGRLFPTDTGRVVYREALRVLGAVAGLQAAVEQEREPGRMPVSVACSETVCDNVIARIVARFHAEHKEIRLRILPGTLAEATARLKAGEVDAALLEGSISEVAVEIRAFHEDRLKLVVPAAHPFAEFERLSFSDIAGEPFVLRQAPSGSRALLLERIGAERLAMLDVVLELASSEALLSCVEEGVGVGFLSDRTAARALAAGTVAIVDLEDVDLTRTFSVGILRGRPLSPAAHAFVHWLESGYPASFAPAVSCRNLGSSA